jgi:hypothetical protein
MNENLSTQPAAASQPFSPLVLESQKGETLACELGANKCLRQLLENAQNRTIGEKTSMLGIGQLESD